MKKIFSVIPLLTIAIFATSMSISAKQIKVSKKNFPDSEVREVLKHDIDKNGDGILSDKEQKKKTSLFLDNVNNIKGISKLEYAEYVEVYHSTMTKIKNVKELYKMKSLNGISFVECNVGAFNPKKIKNLRKISYDSVKSKVRDYDFRNNKQIEKISLISANVKLLKIKGATNLTYLELVGSPQIKKIDLSKSHKLKHLELWNIPLTVLDVSKNTNLEKLEIGGTGIKELDLRKNRKLKDIDIYENREDQSGKKVNVLTIEVEINDTSFPDKHIQEIIKEKADENKDGILQQEEMGQLENLILDDDNKIGAEINCKGLDNFKNLGNLTIKSISGIGIKNFKKIYQLKDLTKLTIKGLTSLKTISPAKFTKLKYIELSNTAINKLDVSKNKKLIGVIFKARKTTNNVTLILRKHPKKYYTYGVSKNVEVIVKKNK